ncbi:LysR family transcriptional regulator [Undibacterium sp. TJN25]|uniref:LysR family transcriptional regulator n=1 Tax=Undibacterium sp. TJN25 TaxID=3413056 RepID=UPI003BF09D66
MRKLDTNALQMFVAVALSLNFRQAAEQLHMSQPPLSRAIKLLEQRLGVQLFERDTQRVALTAAGADLLPRAQQILGLLQEAEVSVARHQAGTRLRLGLTTSVEIGMFSAFTAALQAALGGAALELSFASSPRLVAGLRASRLDAAVIALPTNTYELAVQPLLQQDMMAALQSSHPMARRRSLALVDLGTESVYWFERARQPAFFDHCHAIFREHGFAPHFVREPQDHHVLLGDVAAGRGIALLPQSFTSLKMSGVAYRKLREGKELSLGLGLVMQHASQGRAPHALLAELAHRLLKAPQDGEGDI